MHASHTLLVLCCVVLCCVVLCCVVLCCVVLCCVVLCCVALRCVALRCVALRCLVLFCVVVVLWLSCGCIVAVFAICDSVYFIFDVNCSYTLVRLDFP